MYTILAEAQDIGPGWIFDAGEAVAISKNFHETICFCLSIMGLV